MSNDYFLDVKPYQFNWNHFCLFLFLQSEIHMSEEAIQDILEQTESDPAFQALFDLFDYGR